MPRPLTSYRIADFAGLTDDLPVEARPPQASVLRNLYRQRGKLFARGGQTPLGSNAVGPAQDADGLFWARIGTQDVLFGAHGGSLYDWLTGAAPSALLNGASRLSNGSMTSFAWVAGAVYAGDGVNQNLRLTGTRADLAMTSVPLSAPTTADGGAGSLSSGTYQYKVTFLSADANESEPGPASTALVIGGSRQIALTDIPVCPAGEDCSGRRIYRTADGGTTYLRVTTIADNTTTTYSDNTASLTGNAALVSGNTRFPPTALLVEHHGRLMGADCRTADGDRRTLYISSFDEPYTSPASPDLEDPNQGTRIPLSGASAGQITALASHGQRLAVWTYSHMFLLTGDQPLDYSLQPFAAIGCVAHRTACSHRSALYWLAPDGVYSAAEGLPIRRISEDISEFIDALSADDLSKASAVCWDEKYILTTPAGTRYYDSRYEQWGELSVGEDHDPYPFRQLVMGAATSGRTMRLFGSVTGVGRAWELETGGDDNGAQFLAEIQTGDFDLGNPGREKRIHYVGVTFKKTLGSATISLYRGTSSAAVETFTHDLEETPSAGGTISRFFQRAAENARDEHFRIGVEVSVDASVDLELSSIDGNFHLVT